MRKEDTSMQGKIVTEILQHLQTCNESVEAFYGRVTALNKLRSYILSKNNKPYVLYGAGGSGKTALLSKIACKSMEVENPPESMSIENNKASSEGSNVPLTK